MTHIDTAEMYGDGAAESIVAEAIAGRRDSCSWSPRCCRRTRRAPGPSRPASGRCAPRTDRLDCYLLHWRGTHPLEQTIAAFEQLQQAGKIRSWGVSNFDAEDLTEAQQIAGRGRIACNQVLYHLKERGIEHEVLPWCERNGVAVVGLQPIRPRQLSIAAQPRAAGCSAEIAAAHGATPRQVALRFLTRRAAAVRDPQVVAPGSRRRERRRR